MESQKTITILTAHFGDFDWTECLLKKIRDSIDPQKYSLQLLVINQDRTRASREHLAGLGHPTILEYRRNEVYFSAMGHDHPWVLDCALKKVHGDVLVIFDCDAHPVKEEWVEWVIKKLEDSDAVLAEDHCRPGLSHPCFMAFTRDAYQTGLSFCKGVLEDEEDTGRQIKQQLENAGMKCSMLPPVHLFCGASGILYEQMIYHHGSGTFHASEDSALLGQVRDMSTKIKKLVLESGAYKFKFRDEAGYKVKRLVRKLVKSGRAKKYFRELGNEK